MKKELALMAVSLLCFSCSDDGNTEDEWISPRKCFELMPKNPCNDFDENGNCISDLVGEPDEELIKINIEKLASQFEAHDCIFKKSECITGNPLKDESTVKCKH
jgi:hypothetical protein